MFFDERQVQVDAQITSLLNQYLARLARKANTSKRGRMIYAPDRTIERHFTRWQAQT
ncbi:MAG: hypothetical protein LBL90_05070 [Prevotellaceae bacterium]|jgi:hypothetical protein|nr:hypothetical protein [Prevotellaceae bacterium]